MQLAHIGHVELLVNDLAGSRRFFTEVLGLFVSEETDNRVYLRAWQDWDHHTLVLTRAEESALGHVGWRVRDRASLEAAVRRLDELGVEATWIEAGEESGHGDSVRFATPRSGLPFELYCEVDRYREADEALQSRLPSHPQKYLGVGVAPRRFDHVNFLVDDVAAEQAWASDELGIRHNYFVTAAGDLRLGSWMSNTNVSHEMALMRNKDQSGTRLHHLAYYLDSPDQLLRAATLLAEHGVEIEWGPGSHGTSGAIFLYCFEPSGHRVEVWSGGFLLFDPDWEAIRWDPDTSPLGLEMWGSSMPDSYLTYGTPLAHRLVAPTAGVPA